MGDLFFLLLHKKHCTLPNVTIYNQIKLKM